MQNQLGKFSLIPMITSCIRDTFFFFNVRIYLELRPLLISCAVWILEYVKSQYLYISLDLQGWTLDAGLYVFVLMWILCLAFSGNKQEFY